MISRRGFLGAAALTGLLRGAQKGQPGLPHFAPKAKRIIYLFQSGGPSQIELFDHKPRLMDFQGKDLPESIRNGQRLTTMASGQSRFPVAPSKFKCAQHGQCGMWVSELLPNIARVADDLCVVRSMVGETPLHGAQNLLLHTGRSIGAAPSVGSWVSYGLGTENANLPAFITICPTLTHGGVNNWSSAFLPAPYQGTPIGNASISAEQAKIPFIQSPKP